MIIRKGEQKDIPAIHQLIIELAAYVKEAHKVATTVESMLQDGFGKNPIFQFFVAEKDHQVVGLALFYIRYSTWKGKSIYLEDLVVTESERRTGLGKKLLDIIVQEAKETDCNLVTWQVLDWNEPVIKFSKKSEAQLDAQWINCLLSKGQMENWKS